MDYIRYANDLYRQYNVAALNGAGFSRTLASFHLVDMYPSIKAMEKFRDEEKWRMLYKKSSKTTGSAAIYVHFPFCDGFCSYCHLYKDMWPRNGEAEDRYINSLAAEIALYAKIFGKKIEARSIYFGGGTPSLMSTESFLKIASALRSNFNIAKDCPISFEIYPSKNIDEEKTAKMLGALGDFGVKEIVLDQQSTNQASLDAVGRGNTGFKHWQRIAGLVGNYGDFRIKSSLILGLPHDDLRSFAKSILELTSDHRLTTVSLFLLEFRKGMKISDDLAKHPDLFCGAVERDKMQILARKMLADLGFKESPLHFFTRRSQNNRKTALIGSGSSHLLGFGPSAYGHIALGGREVSYYNMADTRAYNKAISQNRLPVSRIHYLTAKETRMAELIDDLSSLGAVSAEKIAQCGLGKTFKAFERLNLVKTENGRICATEAGRIRTEEMIWYLYDGAYKTLQRRPSGDREVLRHNYLTILSKAEEKKFRKITNQSKPALVRKIHGT